MSKRLNHKRSLEQRAVPSGVTFDLVAFDGEKPIADLKGARLQALEEVLESLKDKLR